jgi:hypothetical protein
MTSSAHLEGERLVLRPFRADDARGVQPLSSAPEHPEPAVTATALAPIWYHARA